MTTIPSQTTNPASFSTPPVVASPSTTTQANPPVVSSPSTTTQANPPVVASPILPIESLPATDDLAEVPSSPPTAITSSSPELDKSLTATSTPGLLEVLGRGQHTKKPSILLKNFVTNTAHTTNPSHAHSLSDLDSSPTFSGNSLYPIANYLTTSVFTKKHQAFLATITTEVVPKT